MGSFVSSCKCTHLRDEAQLFFPLISLSEKIPFSFKEVFQKYREKQISLNWLIQVKTKSQHCSLNHVKGDRGELL